MNNKDKTSGGGAAYFQNSKNAELTELQADLNSMKVDLQKEAMKQIIASMTIGKDVSSLFPHVVKCMKTTNVELKKLIYLYIINYSKAKPDTTLLAVNAFHMDATNKHSPLIRALAVRTMGCIRVNSIVTYLCETLKITLKDEDPYVRKTSCICVAKLYSTCPGLVKESGLIETISTLLTDGNAVVVANAMVALNEISILTGENYLQLKSKMIKRILAALNEANEWGQVFILDALINYNPKKDNYAEDIIESVIPRLSHENSSVVMSAVKVILKFLDKIENVENAKQYCKKISNCLMTVMRSAPEIQYCLLRSLHAIIQKRPFLLDKDYKYFYVKYNDPIYIKLEKIDILYKLTDNNNYEAIIQEFKSYALMEFDVELVKKAVKYIGHVGYKFEKSIDVCIECLKEILDHNMDFTIGEGLIVSRDLMRKYKGKTLELLKKLNSEIISHAVESDARCAVLYMLGEFSNSIKDSTSLIKEFVDNFNEEVDIVKLQILNAVIKNFVNKPEETEEIVKDILQKGGQETENPDVRDRAYIYWRLLESNPDLAKEMILGEKPSFEYIEENVLDNNIVDDIINNMTNISAIYHQASNTFILKEDMVIDPDQETNNEAVGEKTETGEEKDEKVDSKKKKPPKIIDMKVNQNDVDLIGLEDDGGNNNILAGVNNEIINNFKIEDIFNQTNSNNQGISGFENIDFGFGVSTNNNQPKENKNDGFEFDFGGNTNNSSNNNYDDNIQSLNIFSSNSFNSGFPLLVQSANSKGLKGTNGITIYAGFSRDITTNSILLGLIFKNSSSKTAADFKIALNANKYGISETEKSSQLIANFKVNSNSVNQIILPLGLNVSKETNDQIYPGYSIIVNIRCSNDDYSFKVPLKINVLFTSNGKISDQNDFRSFFNQTKGSKVCYSFNGLHSHINNENSLKKVLEDNNIFFVCKNSKSDPIQFYYSSSINDKFKIVFECSFSKVSTNSMSINILAEEVGVAPLIKEILNLILVE